MRRKYIWDATKRDWVEAAEYYAARPQTKGVQIIGDIAPYRSPIDRKIISSRSQHRDHMRQHDVIEVGNERIHERPHRKTYPGGIAQDIARAIEQLGG